MKTLEITAVVGCPLQCNFCPQSKLKAAYSGPREFTLDSFALCLTTVPKHVRIDLSGFSECLIHKDIAQMMRIAKHHGHELHIYTTLVGLNEEKLAAIKDCVDFVRIHVPDVKEMVVPCEKWIKLHNLWKSANIPATYMTMGDMTVGVMEHLEFYDIPVERPDMLSRGGALWEVKKSTGHIICGANRWHQNVVLPNLDVYGDCMDYGLTVKLGNLGKQPYSEIYEAAEQWEKSFKDEQSICSSCEWNAGNK